MKFRILIKQDKDGMFISEIPELPGCISQGKSREESITNIKDAILGYKISLKKHNEPIPFSIDEDMVEINAMLNTISPEYIQSLNLHPVE